MARQESGHIVSLMPAVQGDQLDGAAAIGATSLVVGDVADFDEGGGFCLIAGVVYGYSGVDDDTSTVFLTSGLSAAAADNEPVQIWDEQSESVVVEYVALVMLDYMTSGDPLEAGVSHELIDMLEENTRALVGESVTVEWGDDDDLTVVEVHGKRPVNQAIITAVDPLDANLAQLQTDLAANQADLDAIQGLFPITSTSISDGAISTPKLAANSVTADKIVANSIGADKIIANSIGADKLTANAIDGKVITGATVQTSGSANTGIKLNSTGLQAWDGTGFRSFFLHPNGDVDTPGCSLTSSMAAFTGAINVPAGGTIYGGLYIGTGGLNVATGPITLSSAVHGGSFYADGAIGGGLTTASIDDNGRIHRTTSSRRYKDNIVTVDDDLLDKAMDVRLVTFTRKDDERDEPAVYVGAIAEEVAELGCDALVFHNAEGEVEGIHYDGLAAVALAAVQRESARKDAQIADLTATLAALAERVAALEAAA